MRHLIEKAVWPCRYRTRVTSGSLSIKSSAARAEAFKLTWKNLKKFSDFRDSFNVRWNSLAIARQPCPDAAWVVRLSKCDSNALEWSTKVPVKRSMMQSSTYYGCELSSLCNDFRAEKKSSFCHINIHFFLAGSPPMAPWWPSCATALTSSIERGILTKSDPKK